MEYVIYKKGHEVFRTKNLSAAVEMRDENNENFYLVLQEAFEKHLQVDVDFAFLLAIFLDPDGNEKCLVLE